MKMLALGSALSAILAFSTAPGFAADAVADFYNGRTVYLQIGAGVSGIYDTIGRIFARHIGKHIPGRPTVVPQNVPGGGSLPLANQFGNTTPRDGSVIGVFNNGMPTTPLFEPQVAHFDARKFNFLGSPSREAHVLGVSSGAPTKTLEDVFVKETIVGASAPGGAPFDFPRLTNVLIGTKFKIVTGYQSEQETGLAIRRGEIHGNAGLAWSTAKLSYSDDIAKKEFTIIAAFGIKKNRELTDVPLFPLGKTAEDRQLFELMYGRQSYGRPFATPPEVPADRVRALRTAFESTMKDPEFLAEAERLKLEIDPVSADELTQLTAELYKASPELLDRMRKLLAPAGN